jgi:hypothetical protein
VVLDQADLAHAGLELGGAADVVDRGQLAQQVGDLGAPVSGEVTAHAHARAEVLGLADVQHPAGGVAEQVYAGAAGEAVGQVDLLEAGAGAGGGELQQVLQGEHAVGAGPLQQGVEDVDGRPGVGQGAVAGRHRGTQECRQRGQADVGDLVAGEQLAGEAGGADDPVGQPRVAVAFQVGLEEAPVEGGVVGDQHGVAEELEQAGEHHLDGLGVGDHAVADAGQGGDDRWDGISGSTRVWKLPSTSPPRTLTAPTSVTRSLVGEPPVGRWGGYWDHPPLRGGDRAGGDAGVGAGAAR